MIALRWRVPESPAVKHVWLWIAQGLLAVIPVPNGRAAEPLYRLDLPGRTLEGTPLVSSQQKALWLARDGQCFEFTTSEASNMAQVGGGFKSYSQAEIRGLLLKEFGQGYEVSGVGHYLVVHPAGKRDQWAPRFEELYRSFLQYFAARGWQLEEPRFPLVAVVYPREADF